MSPEPTETVPDDENEPDDEDVERAIDATAAAVRLAGEHELDLSRVTGSGVNGRITFADVQTALEVRELGDAAAGALGVAPAPGSPELALGAAPGSGGDADVLEGFKVCPACAGAGAVPVEVQEDKTSERCADCAGHGVVLTGSLVEEHAIAKCVACSGTGHVIRAGQAEPWRAPAEEPSDGEPVREPWEEAPPPPRAPASEAPPGFALVPLEAAPAEYRP